jgi:hypothetical protein
MTYIKAIETEYKGYRFRSRLEARWAVCFDKLGLEWVYESEGFVLDDGITYLPDFYLAFPIFNRPGLYVEIKPSMPLPGSIEIKKLNSFNSDLTRLIVLLRGLPENEIEFVIQATDQCVPVWLGYQDGRVPYILPGEKLNLCILGLTKEGYCAFFPDGHITSITECQMRVYRHSWFIQSALRVARGARFEHGEKPETLHDVLSRLSAKYATKKSGV